MIGNVGYANEQAYLDSFTLADEETLESVIAYLDQVAAETGAAVAALDDLGDRVQLPEAPWYPQDPDGFSAAGSCFMCWRSWPGMRVTRTSFGNTLMVQPCTS